jgi:hypothetical protein
MVLYAALPAQSQTPYPDSRYPGYSTPQSPFPDIQKWPQPTHHYPDIGGDPTQKAMVLRQLRALRQKALIKDTQKLLSLAAELNAEIGQSRPGALSKRQIQKVAQIEKLARNVEKNMKRSYNGNVTTPTTYPMDFPNPQ